MDKALLVEFDALIAKFTDWRRRVAGAVDAPTQTPTQTLNPASPPGKNFDLTHWKLQLPGPRDETKLATYSDKNFHTDSASGAMVFWLDSAAKGTTTNSEYVRAELRERINPTTDKENWPVAGTHKLELEMELKPSQTLPPQVTVAQIHGITAGGDSAPPLLRLSLMGGELVAWVKRDNDGKDTDKVNLGRLTGRFSLAIRVEGGSMAVDVNGAQKMQRDVKFWKHHNYFKVGLYAQAQTGISESHVYRLRATHA